MSKFQYRRIIQKARELFLQAKYEEAIKEYETVYEMGLTHEDMVNLGSSYIEAKKYPQAENLFKTIILHDKDARSCYSLAFIYEEEGRYDEALQYYEEAIEIEPNHVFLYYDCAFLYDHLQRYSEAKKYYELALTYEPKHFWSHLNLGAILEQEGKDEEALEHFQKAYEIDSKQNMIAYNLGVVYSKLQDHEKSLLYYLEELTKPEPYPQTHYNLGILYKIAYKDYEKAKQAYLKGLEKSPEQYELWYNLGCLYVLMNDYKNATECFTYVYYKKRSLFQYMKEDGELADYIKSPEYQSIVQK
ncbi:MAG: tetratricopeptide repeat protein [Bacilli bacterium]|nr:tetratricopeptide repeat protein [Bacilli bacterium]